MGELHMKHWQDPVNGLIGAWLIISPWILGYQVETMAMTNVVVVGLLLIAAAAGAIFVPHAWEEWTECGLGVWLVISPWVLGFASMQTPMLNVVVSGLVILVLALWVLFTDKDYLSWWSDRPAA